VAVAVVAILVAVAVLVDLEQVRVFLAFLALD
jgi:hypothetical protein